LISIIFKNLLENAIKYSSHSPIEIRLKNERRAIEVTIINPAAIEVDSKKLSIDFKDKFVRGNTPEPGQGLGLYIADKISAILNIQLIVDRDSSHFAVKVVIPKL
jgi:K+-sensing histidine kinase KdpD